MPELPEVETTARGLKPLIVNQSVIAVGIYRPKLRWEIPKHLATTLINQFIQSVERRAKYLLINFEGGTLVIHLGMSGSIRVVPTKLPLKKHEHFELKLYNNTSLRLDDPRRFGAVLWQKKGETLSLFDSLGPEPLTDDFNANYLFQRSRGRTQNIKTFVMNSTVVVGVGNIYASESLFLAKISPKILAGKISLKRYQVLIQSIKSILSEAIDKGGTTLKDFSGVDDKPGYFAQKLSVYDRVDKPCLQCNGTIKKITQNQRTTYYCSKCQK
ncbi:MAG: bifunctional DNA-formamidopyrimidine glycosylase/DNA-(apurinic or apyrimidinic site) lyase [Gammaproteobacteria bacterium]|nr:bifunctional DNA-formamidopyrimidine glycosylase/DNA-(apurinic or apyrimidinic site) lyase [Gammaproteobacteria bacterium]